MRILLAGLLLTVPAVAAAQSPPSALEAGVFFTHVWLEQVGSTDHQVGTSAGGLGGRVGWRFTNFFALDSELAVHPNSGVNGYRVQGFAGIKAGLRVKRVGVYGKARPGFLYFSKDPFGVGRPGSTFFRMQWANSLDPALDVGAVIEWHAADDLILRVDVGDTIVRYSARSVFVSQHEPERRIDAFTTRNRQWSVGIGKRF